MLLFFRFVFGFLLVCLAIINFCTSCGLILPKARSKFAPLLSPVCTSYGLTLSLIITCVKSYKHLHAYRYKTESSTNYLPHTLYPCVARQLYCLVKYTFAQVHIFIIIGVYVRACTRIHTYLPVAK